MSYKIIVPRELQTEYDDLLESLGLFEDSGDSNFGDFLGVGFDNTFSQMFGGAPSKEPEITREIFEQIKNKFGLLMTGNNEYKLMYVRNN